MIGVHLNYYIIEMGQDTEKGPGDLRRLAVTQTPVKDHQRWLMRKNSRHEWVGKVIHCEFCKKFKFNHINKCYLPKTESVLENETRKILLHFEIQNDQLISAKTSNRQLN